MLALSQFSVLLFAVKGGKKFLGSLQSKNNQVQLLLMKSNYMHQAQ